MLPCESFFTEYDCEKILKNRNIFAGYKNINGIHQDITKNALRLFTKKKFTEEKDIVGKTDFDLFERKHWKILELYQKHDQLALTGKIWRGIEPVHLDHQFSFMDVTKKVVVDHEMNISGYVYYTNICFDESFNKSIIELIDSHEFLSKNKENLEFYKPNALVALTDREMECLFYTLRGKSAKSIGLILKISHKTVEFHLEKIKFKFNCLTKSQLISKAIELGYLKKITRSILSLSCV